MSESANIRSIPAIRDFRAAVIEYQDDLRSCLDVMSVEVSRATEWITQDRPRYWEVQLRKAFDQMNSTRVALSTCQMRTVAGRKPSCIEEKQAYAAAKRRLDHCQEQIKNVRRWGVKLAHEVNEFRGRMSGLRRLTEADLPHLVALLDRMATILSQYAEMSAAEQPPTDE